MFMLERVQPNSVKIGNNVLVSIFYTSADTILLIQPSLIALKHTLIMHKVKVKKVKQPYKTTIKYGGLQNACGENKFFFMFS